MVLELSDNDIATLIDVVDWAIMEGYNTEKDIRVLPLLMKMVKDHSSEEDKDYFKERYGF